MIGLSADARLLAAWYGADGKMLGIASRGGSAYRRGESVAFGADAATVRLMIVDKDTFRPLCGAVAITR